MRQKKDRLAEVLYNLTESITIGASLLSSFMPQTSEKIVSQLHTSLRNEEELNEFGAYVSGTKVTDQPEILFARLDVQKTMEKVNALMESKKPKDETPEEPVIDIEPKEEITYDDFMKMQFQVGEIHWPV